MEQEKLKEIGQRITKRRKELNLTQEKVAEFMNVSVQMISNLERGNKAIKIENLIKLSEILKVSTDYILIGKINEKDKNNLVEELNKLSKEDYKMIELIVDYKNKTSEQEF